MTAATVPAPNSNHNLSNWVRRHDRYDDVGHVAATGRWVPEALQS
jgi:hypothetical protein